ncbi:hypothetical protein [Zunongwangia sp.]|uniref:hypothetical protein n=1 Tax=Zunongwangia sp. TaxID=1965325 RepID=UPI003AA8E515
MDDNLNNASASALFKDQILPKLDLSDLGTAEHQALLQVLELLNAEDSRSYLELKKSLENQAITPDFSAALSQQIYHHPEIYADEAQGFDWVASWLPLLKNGFFPDEQHTEKLLEFLYFGLAFLQSEKISEETQAQVFEVFSVLIHSKSEASLPVARFLLHRAFDLRDYQTSHFLVQQCLSSKLLTETYFAKDENEVLQEFPFRINDIFVEHFYKGSWELLLESMHQVLPVSIPGKSGAYEVLKPWLSEELASFYAANDDWAIHAHQHLVERVLFTEDESFDYLNLHTAAGKYPLITAFAEKEWDESDVLLFSLKDKNIPLEQTEAGFYKLQDWLLANNRTNFNREVFDNYGKAVFAVNSARELPVKSISLWFEMCNATQNNLRQKAYFNEVFSHLLTAWQTKKLPLMSKEGNAFQVTGIYVLTHVLGELTPLKDWLPAYQASGLSDPLNQFLLLCFYDSRSILKEHISEESSAVLYDYLISIAYSARETKPYLREIGVKLCVEILTTVYKHTETFAQVNEIASLKNLHSSVVAQCEDFAKFHYVNEKTDLTPQIIQSWYLFLNDYYYSLGKEFLWVDAVLRNQGARLAAYFNAEEEGSFPDEILYRLYKFLKMCSKRSDSYSELGSIGSAIATHLSHLLQDLKPEKLSKNVVEILYNYINGPEINAFHQMQLENEILPFYAYYFQEEKTTETISEEEEDAEKQEETIDDGVEEETEIEPAAITFDSEAPLSIQVLEQLILGLSNYQKSRIASSVYKAYLAKNEAELKALLEEDTTLKMNFYQVLYLLIIDLEAAPGSAYEAYGNLGRSLFVTLVKGSTMALSYTQGLEMMAASGAYPEKLSQALQQVVTDLNE